MVSLFESLLSQSIPTIGTVDETSSLQCDIKITTFDCKIEPGVLIFNEVQCNLDKIVPFEMKLTPDSLKLTSGNPFCCRYAMMLWPKRFEVRIMYNISS